MKLIINKDRSVIPIGTWGTKNENNYEILDFEFPEELENYNKRIVYYLDNQRVWDAIINNKAILTNAITTKGTVKAYVWLTLSETITLKYVCDGTEEGNYYFTYDNTNHYFTMPEVAENDELIYDVATNKLKLGNTEIATTTTGNGTELTFNTIIDAEEDFRTQLFEMHFYENENADGIVPTQQQVDGFNTMLTAMNNKIDEVDALEQTIETAEAQRQEAEATRVSNENTRESNESTRQTNEQTRQTQEADRERRTDEAIADIEDKIAEYNANAEAKTTAFNNNATQKTNEFNSNYTQKVNDFNTNASSKTSAFNSNAETKTNTFNTNATNKTNAFNSNASEKTTTFDNNASTKTSEFNTNAESKTSAFNDNATEKTTNFDNNASEKTDEFNTNAQEKIDEYDEHIVEYQAQIDELQEEVEELSENMPWNTTEQATEITVDDAAKYSRNKLELFGNTSQDSTSIDGGDEYDSPSPDHPQPIHVVTGNNSVGIQGENLFDKDNYNIKSLNAGGGGIFAAASNQKHIYIQCKPNTDYVVVKNVSNTPVLGIYETENEPAVGVAYTSLYFSSNSDGKRHVTTSATAQYLDVRINTAAITQAEIDAIVETLIIAEGTDTNISYVSYYHADYPINLGPIELCKIGSRQDYLYKENGNWYIEKILNKYVFSGNENISKATDVFYTNDIANNILTSGIICLCNRMKAVANTSTGSSVPVNCCCFRPGDYSRFYFNLSSITTDINEIKQYLFNNNTYVIYPLAVPTSTQITDETLISQLDEVYEHLKLVKGTNNITVTAEDLAPYMKLTYMQDLPSKLDNLDSRLSLLE